MRAKLFKLVSVLMIALILITSAPLTENMCSDISSSFSFVAQAAKDKKKIRLKKSKVNVTVGFTYIQKLLGTNGKAIAGKKVKWKSANKKVATVSKTGKVTAKKIGKTKITATYNGKQYTFTVRVKKPTIAYKTKSLPIGGSFTQSLKNTAGKKIKNSKITWTTSNIDVAIVNAKGVVKAKKLGTATITAIYKGKKYKSTVTVKTAEEIKEEIEAEAEKNKPSIKLNKTSLSLKKGETATLKATVNPSKSKVTWKSANKSVAKVNSSGKVTAVAKGTTVITASIIANGKTYKATCNVAVDIEAVKLADKLSKPYYVLDENSVYVQDFAAFCEGDVKQTSPTTYEYDNISQSRILKYIEMLTKELNFELADEYHYRSLPYFDINFNLTGYYIDMYSYGLNYTGKSYVGDEQSMSYKDGEYDIVIDGAMDFDGDNNNTSYFRIRTSSDLEILDLGFREDGNNIEVPGGPSFYEGLTKTGHTYTTTDLRFSVDAGSAMVIENGDSFFITSAETTSVPELNYETVKIDISGTEGSGAVKFAFPLDGVYSEDIYFYKDFVENAGMGGDYDFEPELNNGTVNFSYYYNNKWKRPVRYGEDIHNMVMRVLYADDDELVLYIYLDNNKFEKGRKIEILCAIDRDTVVSDTPQDDDGITPYVELDQLSAELFHTQTLQLKANTYPSDAKVTWKSNNIGVATVDSNGLVTAVGSGNAEIIASITENHRPYKSVCRLKVKSVSPSMKINYGSRIVTQGTNEQIDFAYSPSFAELTWTTSNSSVAVVSPGGVLTAIGEGSAVITGSFTFDGTVYSDSFNVRVDPYEKTLAAALPEDYLVEDDNSVYVQTLYDFSDCELSIDNFSDTWEYFYYYPSTDRAVVDAYIDVLTTECNFEIAEQVTGTYWSVALNYTGNADVTPEEELMFSYGETTLYDLVIYGYYDTDGYVKSALSVNCSSDLELVDLGYRYNSEKVSDHPSGFSTSAGLNLKGKVYSTTDGRFSANLGETIVLRNGVEIPATVTVERTYKNYLSYKVSYTVDGETKTYRYAFEPSAGTGLIREFRDIADDFYYQSSYEDKEAEFIYYKGGWVQPVHGSEMNDVTIRLLYRDDFRLASYVYIDNGTYDDDSVIEIFSVEDLGAL